jgi:phosphinothricin acetyltransferase
VPSRNIHATADLETRGITAAGDRDEFGIETLGGANANAAEPVVERLRRNCRARRSHEIMLVVTESRTGMSLPVIRPATLDDLAVLTDIYNYYVVNTTVTFDLRPFAPEERRGWFDEHAAAGRHRLIVAVASDATVVGYATTSRWRPKAAYDTTVESSVYLHPAAVGRGVGTALYLALFGAISAEDVHRIVAGVSLPNPASIKLHERLGFRPVGVFAAVGRKFNRYCDVAWFERPLRY